MPISSTSPDVNAGAKCEYDAASGPIQIKRGSVFITAPSAAALTIPAPIAGQDDGTSLTIVSTTAFAHTITAPANGINGTLHLATFAAAVGNAVSLRAYNGSWWAHGASGVTLS